MIYLDNAATTFPKPPAVMRAVGSALRDYSANPGRGGHQPSVRTARAVYEARRNIAGFFGMSREENVIFTSNCTEALNTVIKGVLEPGDHVVISSLEHNSVLRPIEAMDVTYTAAQVTTDDEETIDNFRKAINEKTRLIICTHASNVFGIIPPVERLCALAHSYGIAFCLDAAQSAGTLEMYPDKDGYDFVCCAGHKGLYGPMGTGLLLINTDMDIKPLKQGGTGSESADPRMPSYLPDRLESGTINVPGILGLSAGVSFVKSKGIGRIYDHESRLIAKLYRELRDIPGVILYTGEPESVRTAPVLSFNIEGSDSESVARFLDEKYHIAVRAGLHCSPLAHRSMGTIDSGTVRIAPSAFNTVNDIDAVATAVRRFVRTK